MTQPMEEGGAQVRSVPEDFVIDSEVFLIAGIPIGFILCQKLLSLAGKTAATAALAADHFFREGKLQGAFRSLQYGQGFRVGHVHTACGRPQGAGLFNGVEQPAGALSKKAIVRLII